MLDNDKPKFESVFDYIMRGITSGAYRPDVRLPSERLLATTLAVNVATVRRAFRELVVAGLVEKRVGDGTYLRRQPAGLTRAAGRSGDADDTVVNLVLSTYRNAVVDEVAELARREAERRNWNCHVARLDDDAVPEFLRAAVRFGLSTLLLDGGSLTPAAHKEIQAAPRRFAVLANRLDHLGIPSVVADDNHGIRLIVNRLRGLGHTRIALLRNHSGHPVENIQAAVWRAVTRGDGPELRGDVPVGKHPGEYAERAVRAALPAEAGYTALVCLNEELALGALHALNRRGLDVPGDCSVVTVGDTETCRFATPPLTALNPNLSEHVRQGFDLLAQNAARADAPEMLRVVEPVLVPRESDGPLAEALAGAVESPAFAR